MFQPFQVHWDTYQTMLSMIPKSGKGVSEMLWHIYWSPLHYKFTAGFILCHEIWFWHIDGVLYAVHRCKCARYERWKGKLFIDSAWFTIQVEKCSKVLKRKNIVLLLQKERQVRPCLWNGMRRPCYLFARKFYPEAVDNLMFLFSNYPTIWF